ncbi:MAG: hypothetical protein IJ167_04370 [Lachnospiraceae bacterium]|nr:hypothetical protein [Lachnospiraceae bacterium]
MKRFSKKLSLLLCVVMLAAALCGCGKDSDGGSKDAIAGTWKQTDEINGDWTWTFDGKGKCTLKGDTTGFSSNGTYTLDEAGGKVTVDLESWMDKKEYSYTLNGNNLDLEETYSSYHLIKQ